MSTPQDTCVSKVPLFATLSLDQQLEVARFASAVRRGAGETLQLPGDTDSVLVVVHQGAIRVSRLAADGQEQLVRLLQPGDFAGEIDYVTGKSAGHMLTAETDVEVCQFRHSDLATLIKQFPDIAVQMLQAVTGRLRDAEQALSAATSTDATARLAHYLLGLTRVEVGDSVAVYLPTTKRHVASLIGVTPETLSRRLKQLSTRGLIEVEGSKITLLDLSALEKL